MVETPLRNSRAIPNIECFWQHFRESSRTAEVLASVDATRSDPPGRSSSDCRNGKRRLSEWAADLSRCRGFFQNSTALFLVDERAVDQKGRPLMKRTRASPPRRQIEGERLGHPANSAYAYGPLGRCQTAWPEDSGEETKEQLAHRQPPVFFSLCLLASILQRGGSPTRHCEQITPVNATGVVDRFTQIPVDKPTSRE
jgi:hypothetical protein